MLKILRNEKGMVLVSVYLIAFLILSISGAAFGRSFSELHQVEREVARLRSFAAAEAGVQTAIAQIASTGIAYTGFINTTPIPQTRMQAVYGGDPVASFSATLDYPQQADWVIIKASGSADGDTRALEARVFLESNLSKYLVYADTSRFASGTNAQYGNPDMTDKDGDGNPDYPERVPANEDDRASLYFTGRWDIVGSNVHLYGDAHAEDYISGNSSTHIHGDTYSSSFTQTLTGTVINDGVEGPVNVGDGFDDDIDRNGDLTVDQADYPDYHDLTADGEGDAHAKETLVKIDHNFYATHNAIPTFGQTTKNRYLEFKSVNNGTATQVIEYQNASFRRQVATYSLPSSAIVYVKGDIYVKGEIGGRVSVVSSDDIIFDGNLSYANGAHYASPTQSAAFLAKDRLYFRPDTLEVSGILYAEAASGASIAFNAAYNQRWRYDGRKSYLRLYGNRIIKGRSNLGIYADRIYGYDRNLRYFRPPGMPVYPELRTVREIDPTGVAGGGS